MAKIIIVPIAFAIFAMLVPALTWAADISVPGDFPTIQEAVDAAGDGDTVKVAAGNYDEIVYVDEKQNLTIQGDGATSTTVQKFSLWSSEYIKIEKFNITNGISTYIVNNLTISNNITAQIGLTDATSVIIDNNIIQDSNGGVSLFDPCSATISNNLIINNDSYGINLVDASYALVEGNLIAGNGGHGIIVSDVSGFGSSHATLYNNIIAGNSGAGITVTTPNYADITNNTITGNTGGGVYIDITGGEGDTATTITNNILWGNGDDLYSCNAPYCLATYSDIEDGDGGTGNISANPMFVDSANGDYHLGPTSPAINVGLNSAADDYNIITDFEGDPRIVGGTVDMGADEVALALLGPSIDIMPDMSLTTQEDPTINTHKKGNIPVVILGSAYFDIENVDVTSPTFGPDDAEPTHDLSDPLVYANHMEDVNMDGYLDLVMHFNNQDTGITTEDTEACLTFTVNGGAEYELCHGIRTK